VKEGKEYPTVGHFYRFYDKSHNPPKWIIKILKVEISSGWTNEHYVPEFGNGSWVDITYECYYPDKYTFTWGIRIDKWYSNFTRITKKEALEYC